MKSTIFTLIIIGVAIFGYSAYEHNKEKVKEEPAEPVIAQACEWLNSIDWEDGDPPADTFYIDGVMCFGSMPVRGAERAFETIVNHSHVYFMTEK